MTLTFTAVRTTAFVTLTASGAGQNNAGSYITLRVLNNGVSTGGTRSALEAMAADEDIFGIEDDENILAWNCVYSTMLTGLTPGTSYTLSVQGLNNGSFPNSLTATIDAASNPDQQHMTLCVFP
jgi:hypothetical protein